jgi:hypothetical protein
MSTNERKTSLTAMVWQRIPGKYTSAVTLVLLKLAGLSEREGYARMSVPTLAKMCGITERYAHMILKDLKKDGLLTVKYRKGKSSHITLSVAEIEKLALVMPEREDTKTAEQPKAEKPAAQPSAHAVELAQRIHDNGLPKMLPEAIVPDDWQTSWPVVLQPLFDAGHTLGTLRHVASSALKSQAWRKEMSADPVGTLAQNFEAFHRLWQAEQKKEAA